MLKGLAIRTSTPEVSPSVIMTYPTGRYSRHTEQTPPIEVIDVLWLTAGLGPKQALYINRPAFPSIHVDAMVRGGVSTRRGS
jgi:hypothetical protein